MKLGKTRWWSAFKAISRISDEPNSYFILLSVLWELSTSNNSTAATKRASEALLKNYLSFTSVLTVIVLKTVLAEFDPVTKYLQTRGLDMNQAVQMIESEKKAVLTYRSKYDDFYEEATKFRSKV